MWDLKGWYRQFHVPPTTWATHQRVWAQNEGPSVVVDQAMMFGDRPASNWAMRFSRFIAHAVAELANAHESQSTRVRQAMRLLRWADEQADAEPSPKLVHSFVTCFIDDFGC